MVGMFLLYLIETNFSDEKHRIGIILYRVDPSSANLPRKRKEAKRRENTSERVGGEVG
jgi:hypothetical protein